MPWPGQDQGPLGFVDQLQGLRVFGFLGRQVGAVAGQLRPGGFPIEFAGRLLRVFRYINEYGARASGTGHIKCLAQDLSQFAGVGDEVIVLGDGKRDAGNVGFLKSVGADQLAAYLSGDANDRGRIQHRRGNAGDHVGRARAGSRDRDADFAAGAGIAVCHMRGALLVTHQDVMDIAVFEGVICRQNCASRIAEDVLHALALQAFPQNLCSRFCHRPCPQSWISSAATNHVGTAAPGCPAERSSADFVAPQHPCRAALDWTAGGGCPHAILAAAGSSITSSQPVIILPRDNLPARPRGRHGRRAPFLSRLPHQDAPADLPC